jgi:hypothetical protein
MADLDYGTGKNKSPNLSIDRLLYWSLRISTGVAAGAVIGAMTTFTIWATSTEFLLPLSRQESFLLALLPIVMSIAGIIIAVERNGYIVALITPLWHHPINHTLHFIRVIASGSVTGVVLFGLVTSFIRLQDRTPLDVTGAILGAIMSAYIIIHHRQSTE